MVAQYIRMALTDFFLSRGLPIPELTARCVMKPGWILLIPVILLGCLLVTLRKKPAIETALVWACAALLVLQVVSFIVILTCLLPWLPLHA